MSQLNVLPDLNDCYSPNENDIIDTLIKLQDQIDYLLDNWSRNIDYNYKMQIADEIASICATQKSLREWLNNSKLNEFILPN